MTKRLLLSVPDSMYKKLQTEMELYSYSSLQEIILGAIREKFYIRPSRATGAKRGRPRKIDPLNILGRKKIFSS